MLPLHFLCDKSLDHHLRFLRLLMSTGAYTMPLSLSWVVFLLAHSLSLSLYLSLLKLVGAHQVHLYDSFSSSRFSLYLGILSDDHDYNLREIKFFISREFSFLECSSGLIKVRYRCRVYLNDEGLFLTLEQCCSIRRHHHRSCDLVRYSDINPGEFRNDG